MTTIGSVKETTTRPKAKNLHLTRYVPFLDWLVHYRRADLVGDSMAGLIVAIMLVPQGMAYALLAGLPPQVGLYASIVPLVIYGLLGTSRTLAVGPVAIVSLLVASAITPLAEPGSAEYIRYALVLALLVGLIQLGMGMVRLGFLVNSTMLSYRRVGLIEARLTRTSTISELLDDQISGLLWRKLTERQSRSQQGSYISNR